ncbi:MAG: glycosyltransferase [Acidimicrobiales bacterium]
MIHQLVPMLHASDAVGQHTMAVQDALVGRGLDSKVFVEIEDPETADRTLPFADYPGMARRGDVLVYQFATASDVADWLVGRPETVVVNYHNVTPPESFAPWDNALARHQMRARLQLEGLAADAALGVAVSEVNRADLMVAGFARTAVVPPVMRVQAVGGDARTPRHRGARWLAVGRLAPNKAVEDAVLALFAYRCRFDPEAALLVVGKPAVATYAHALRRFVADLGLADAVAFAGRVDDRALSDAYDRADVLVVMSEHEGFCLPVTEAMARLVPVVAYRQGAVPEVLGDAGVLLDAKDARTVAEAVHRLQLDDAWRLDRVEAGRERLEALQLDDAGERLADLLVAVHARDPWPAGVAETRGRRRLLAPTGR